MKSNKNSIDLNSLRKKLLEEKDLSKVWTYFMDNYGENPDFHEQNIPSEPNELLNQFIVQIGEQIFQRSFKAVKITLFKVPNQHFIHGAVFFNGLPGNVIYFEDIHVGLLSVTKSLLTMETMFSRFTAAQVPPKKK